MNEETQVVNNNYLITYSVSMAISFWKILFFWLIIPLLIMIKNILYIRSVSVELSTNGFMITRSGVFSKNETKNPYPMISAVSVHQSLFGRMFDYGDVDVVWTDEMTSDANRIMSHKRMNAKGLNAPNTHHVKHPMELKAFLETILLSHEQQMKSTFD